MTWVAVAIGGALGSMARHGVNVALASRIDRVAPFGTLAVNVIGCVVIGALAGLIASGRLHLVPFMRVFVFVGVLGGFTTFSSFGLDTLTLAQRGELAGAFWNVAGQLGLGLGGVWLGFYLSS